MTAALCGLLALRGLLADPSWVGMPLADYIKSLGAAGLPVIFSDDLVTDELRVTQEPAAAAPDEALRAVLRPHGLLLVAGPNDNWLVVADPEALTVTPAASQAPADESEILPEIIVNSSVYSIRYQQAGSHTFLDRDFVSDLPDVGEEALRAIDRLPGVANGGVSTRSHVRGGAKNEQLILLDGLRLYEPYHLKDFQAFQSIINESAIDGIDFYTAGYQARYGDRMSGVIDIGLRPPPEMTETELGISIFNTSALSTGRFLADRGDWLVSGRRSNLASVNRALKKDYGEPDFEDVLAHVGWQWTERSYVAANFLFSRDRISIAQADGSETAIAAYRNNVGWLKMDFDWSDAVSVTTIASATDIANSRDGQVDIADTVAGTVADSRSFSTIGLKQDWQIIISDRWILRTGIDITVLHAAYNYASTLSIFPPFEQLFDNQPLLVRSQRVRPKGEQYASYVEGRFKVRDNIFIDMGLRLDRQTYSVAKSDEQSSPRLNVLYRLSDQTELRAGVGRFYQAQEINELQVNDGLVDFFAPQHANHFVASLLHSFPAAVDLRIEFYQKNYFDLSPRFENVFNTLVLLPELQIDRLRIDADRSLVRGAEISVSGGGDEDKLRWWLGYSWSRAEDTVGSRDVRRSWDQTHAVKFGVISDWGRWTLGAAGSWHSGWPKTNLRLEPTMNPDGSAGWLASTTPHNSLHYDSFQSLDVRASRVFELPRSELTAFIEVSNLLNRENGCCTAYSMRMADNGSSSLKKENDHWLPLVPSIGVLWRF